MVEEKNKEEKNKEEFLKLMQESEHEREAKNREKIKRLDIIANGDNGKDCYFRVVNTCWYNPKRHTVEGNCVCGFYKPIANLPKK